MVGDAGEVSRSDGQPVWWGRATTAGPGVVLGLLADLPRKNCWTIAEHAGDASTDGMHYLLGRAVWDTEGVCDDLCDYVVETSVIRLQCWSSMMLAM